MGWMTIPQYHVLTCFDNTVARVIWYKMVCVYIYIHIQYIVGMYKLHTIYIAYDRSFNDHLCFDIGWSNTSFTPDFLKLHRMTTLQESPWRESTMSPVHILVVHLHTFKRSTTKISCQPCLRHGEPVALERLGVVSSDRFVRAYCVATLMQGGAP